MNDELPSAPDAEADGVPILTLVLPPDLADHEIVAGLLRVISQSLSTLGLRADRFSQMAEECTARGGREFRLGLLRGQARGGTAAATTVVENIVEVFGLWSQYAAQTSPSPAPSSPGQTRPRGQGQGSPVLPDSARPSRIRSSLSYRPDAPASATARMEGEGGR